MRAVLPFLACLMLFVTGITSFAHASELPGSEVTAMELAAWHSPGDGDEVPGDTDKASPHHHAICHGHDLAGPVHAPAAALLASDDRVPAAPIAAALGNSGSDAPLRPPIA